MNKKEYNIEDLFVHYILRLSKEYPYIKLISDDISTTISLGYEHCVEQRKDISYQAFTVVGKYPVTVNFKKLESFFEEYVISITAVSDSEFLVKNQPKLKDYIGIEDEIKNSHVKISNELMKYLETHKRTVLRILKVRYASHKDSSCNATIYEDPIPIGSHNRTEAYIVLGCDPTYIESDKMNCDDDWEGSSFITSLDEIQHLASDKFDIFILNGTWKSITLEIINTEL